MREAGADSLPDRRLSLALVVGGAFGFGLLAALLVPWHWVPGGHYDHVPARAIFTPSEIARGEHYSALQDRLGYVSYAVSVAVALVLGLTPLGARMVRRLGRRWWWQTIAGSALLLALGTLVTLPFAWRMHRNAVTAGLSVERTGGWWSDQGLSLLVAWVPTAIALLVLVGCTRRWPRRWPLAVAGAAVGLTVLGSFVYPVVVEPLFNHFTPMQQGALRSRILALADEEHVHVSDVLIADASRRTTTLNAYVSGFGSTRRIVVYDTLLDRETPRQVLVVVAHELGHARHQDVLTGTALGVAGGVAGVGLLGLVLSSPRVLRRAGSHGTRHGDVVPLVLALAVVATFLASPVENVISRAVEARADRAALQTTHDYRGFVQVQRQLAVSSLADPTPPLWGQLWFGTHPTALQRVGIARALRARHWR